MGAGAVRHRPRRADPGQHQPRLPQPRTRVRAERGGMQGAGPGPRVQDLGLPRHAARTRAGARCQRAGRTARGETARAAARDRARRRTRARLPAFRRHRPRRRRCARPCRCRAGADRPARSDQHPVHLRHHRLAQGRDAQPSQHPQQRLVRRRVHALRRTRPAVHPGAVLPLLRHGARQPGLRDARRLHGGAGRRLRPAAHAADRAGRTLHRAARRADHVHRHPRASALRRIRPLDPAHRHHGRRALPHRSDEAGHRADAHGRSHHRLRHDRDQPGQLPDHAGRSRRTPRGFGRPHPSAPRSAHRRPAKAAPCHAAKPANCSRAAIR